MDVNTASDRTRRRACQRGEGPWPLPPATVDTEHASDSCQQGLNQEGVLFCLYHK